MMSWREFRQHMAEINRAAQKCQTAEELGYILTAMDMVAEEMRKPADVNANLSEVHERLSVVLTRKSANGQHR